MLLSLRQYWHAARIHVGSLCSDTYGRRDCVHTPLSTNATDPLKHSYNVRKMCGYASKRDAWLRATGGVVEIGKAIEARHRYVRSPRQQPTRAA